MIKMAQDWKERLWRKRAVKKAKRKMRELEDADAYNGDDMQPPFEEKDPRQRKLGT